MSSNLKYEVLEYYNLYNECQKNKLADTIVDINKCIRTTAKYGYDTFVIHFTNNKYAKLEQETSFLIYCYNAKIRKYFFDELEKYYISEGFKVVTNPATFTDRIIIQWGDNAEELSK